jgi:hypothetical protein
MRVCLWAVAVLVFVGSVQMGDAAAQDRSRHAGYYYPDPETTEIYEAVSR